MAYMLEKKQTISTPHIIIDEEKRYMRFEGTSFHENVIVFYKDINEWLDTYLETDFGIFTFDCELEYFNSSTAKLLYNILRSLDDHSIEENKVIVNWITTEDNDIIMECGEDFLDEMNNLEFNLIVRG